MINDNRTCRLLTVIWKPGLTVTSLATKTQLLETLHFPQHNRSRKRNRQKFNSNRTTFLQDHGSSDLHYLIMPLLYTFYILLNITGNSSHKFEAWYCACVYKAISANYFKAEDQFFVATFKLILFILDSSITVVL